MKSHVRGAVAKIGTPAITKDEAAETFSRVFLPHDRILVAVSGGPDSMALLALLAERGQRSIHAVTVDHGLRKESLEEAQMVGRICQKLGVEHHILTWTGVKSNAGLQQAARAARYALLCDFAREKSLTCLTTAHHADDQAETVLMRLTSGSGLKGLAGMQVESQRFETAGSLQATAVRHLRPLLGFSKARLVASCVDRKISFVRDQSNDDPRFERARVRRILESLSSDGLSQERLLRLAERAALADEALDYAASEFLLRHPFAMFVHGAMLDWNPLSEAPKAIRQRVVPKILNLLSSGEFVEKLERVEALVDDIDAAFGDGKALRRSIGHWLVSISRSGALNISAAPPRKRGAKS